MFNIQEYTIEKVLERYPDIGEGLIIKQRMRPRGLKFNLAPELTEKLSEAYPNA